MFLFEYKEDIETIYQKYYQDIDYDNFHKIVEADPTQKKGLMGKYGKWLLRLHKKNNLKLEDLYKATKYLNLFHKFKFKIKKDINQINSLQELFNIVKEYDYEEQEITNEDEQKFMGQFKEVFKNDKYRIIVPLTFEASKYFGRGTEWCTTHENEFNHYTNKQNINNLDENCLYILYTEDLDKRLQFHFSYRQFMDISDIPLEISGFFNENEDIMNFFNSLFDLDIYVKSPEDIVEKWGIENNIKLGIDIDLGDFEDDEEDLDKLLLTHDILLSSFNYDENPMDGSYVVSFYFLCKNEKIHKKFEEFLKEKYGEVTSPVTGQKMSNKKYPTEVNIRLG
jgi:hypothetical protein